MGVETPVEGPTREVSPQASGGRCGEGGDVLVEFLDLGWVEPAGPGVGSAPGEVSDGGGEGKGDEKEWEETGDEHGCCVLECDACWVWSYEMVEEVGLYVCG